MVKYEVNVEITVRESLTPFQVQYKFHRVISHERKSI